MEFVVHESLRILDPPTRQSHEVGPNVPYGQRKIKIFNQDRGPGVSAPYTTNPYRM